MRVTIRQKNLKITPALRVYLEAKLFKPVKRFMKSRLGGDLPILDIEIGRTTKHHRKGRVYCVSASLAVGRNLFRAKAENEDARAACDVLEEELEREILSFKSRRTAKERRRSRRVKQNFRFAKSARLRRVGRVREEGI